MPSFMGASAKWVDDDDATYAHVKREAAEKLRAALLRRVEVLDQVDASTEDILLEMRRQMAACAVDGNLMLSADIGEDIWLLVQMLEGL